MRLRLRVTPDRRQTIGEQIYDIAQTQIAEQGLPTKAIGRWFPYVASLMLFIWTINMIGFIPLPITGERFELFGVELPVWGIYAATSSISVTLALALMTWVFTHYRRRPRERRRRLLQELDPRGPEGDAAADRPARDPRAVHAARLALSASLRQHARGPHADPDLHRADLPARSVVLAVVAVSCRQRAFYLFEVVIVVSIQAFIFAALSAIYIGSAIEPEH